MGQENLVLRSMSEVVAAVPHLLGVHPRDSLVVFPEIADEAPVARVDLPRSPGQSAAVGEGLTRAFAGTGVGVVLLAYTSRPDQAREVCETVRKRLEPEVPVIGSVAVDGGDWVRLEGPQSGRVSQSDRDLMTAEFLLLNRGTPFATPDDLRQAYAAVHPVPDEIMGVATGRAEAAARGGLNGDAERNWITATLNRAAAGQTVLPDRDAARLIADVQHLRLRDHAWASMERESAPRHAELWRNLLTRCSDGPPSRVAPVASLTAFAHWLDGDAVKAQVALQRVPASTTYHMARLIDLALEIGMHPGEWAAPDVAGGRQPEDSEQPRSTGPRAGIRQPPKLPRAPGIEGPDR